MPLSGSSVVHTSAQQATGPGRVPHAVATGATIVLALEGWLIALVVAVSVLPGWSSVAVMSGSMQPTIDVGDVVIVTTADVTRVEPNDVVLVRRAGGDPLLHRVVGVDADGVLTTRGDANRTNDATPVLAEDVVGVGRIAVPLIGLPVVWLRDANLAGLAAFVAVNGVLLIGASSRRSNGLGPRPLTRATIPVSDVHVRALRDGRPEWLHWSPDHPGNGP